MKVDLASLKKMVLPELIEAALNAEDHPTFWLISGFIGATTCDISEQRELWDAAHTNPADYEGARACLRKMMKANGWTP